DRHVGADTVAHLDRGAAPGRDRYGVLDAVEVGVDRGAGRRIAHRELDVERRTGIAGRIAVRDVVVLHAVLHFVLPDDVGELHRVRQVPVVLIGDDPAPAATGGHGGQGQRHR